MFAGHGGWGLAGVRGVPHWLEGRASLTPSFRCRAAGSLRSAMAPPPPCRPPRPPRLLLLLLTVVLLGSQARAEPAAGSAVPAQSKCRAPRSLGPDPTRACERPRLAFVPGRPQSPARSRAPLPPRRWKVGGGRWGAGRGAHLPPALTHAPVGRPCVDCHAFEFMQRALQDLRKTAYSLDARVRGGTARTSGLRPQAPRPDLRHSALIWL